MNATKGGTDAAQIAIFAHVQKIVSLSGSDAFW